MLKPELLRFLRTSRGMTQRELADLLGISAPAIYYFERGDRKLPANRVDQIRAIFGDEYIEQAKQFLMEVQK